MLIIGLGTQKRVGKDSLAAHIIERRPQLAVVRLAYADAVKEEVNEAFQQMFPLTAEVAKPFNESVLRGKWSAFCRHYNIYLTSPVIVDFDDPFCPYGKCRQALQWWGTEYRRFQDEDYWTKQMGAKLLRASLDGIHAALITDMRFPNEHDQISTASTWGSEYGHMLVGFTWKLRRLWPEGQEPPQDSHPSETALDGYAFNCLIEGRTIEETLEAGLREFDSLTGGYHASARRGLRNDRA